MPGSPSQVHERVQALRLYQQGRGAHEIGRDIGRHPTTVTRWLSEAGVALDGVLGRSRRVIARGFWGAVERTEGCWLWTGGRQSGGYGSVPRSLGGGLAHRRSFEEHFGPIPTGQYVCHRCDVRLCVRPDHLFLGTHAENMADMASKGRAPRASQILTVDQVRDVVRRLEGGERQKDVAQELGVCPQTVSDIWCGRNWSHVTSRRTRAFERMTGKAA